MAAASTPINAAALPLTADTLYAIARGEYGPTTDWDVWICSECGRHFPIDTAITALERALGHATILPAPSHTFIVLVNRRRRLAVGFEAVWPYLRVFNPTEKEGRTIRYRRAPLNPRQVRRVCVRAAARIGRGYDLLGLVLALTFLALRKPGWFYVRRARLYCTTYASWLLRSVGCDVLPAVHADNETPASFEGGMAALHWVESLTPPWQFVRPTAAPYHSPL